MVDEEKTIAGVLSIKDWIDRWIQLPEIGLRFDPFREECAENEPKLPMYLVDHDVFPKLWGDWVSAVFAPAGGGKTAFRIRLLHACRTGEDGRRIFPISILSPSPGQNVVEAALQGAAQELLLHLLYTPSAYLSLRSSEQQEIVAFFQTDLLYDYSFLLRRLNEIVSTARTAEDWDRLTGLFGQLDPAAAGLFAPPPSGEVERFLEKLSELPSRELSGDAASRFRWLKELVLGPLGYEAIYVLVDGVDEAIKERRLIEKFLLSVIEWGKTQERVFIKLFLPLEWKEFLVEKSIFPLTGDEQFAIIKWSKDALQELIRSRLQAAAEESRAIASLDALCTPALRGTEEALLEVVQPNPRDVVRIVETLFEVHVERMRGPYGRLEPEDLDAAIHWYREQLEGRS